MYRRETPRRWTQLKKLVEKLKKGGYYRPKDLKEQLGMPISTVKHDLKLGKYIGIFDQDEEKGPYRWIDYEPEEPSIRKALEKHFPDGVNAFSQSRYMTTLNLPEEALKDAAVLTGNDPNDPNFRKRFFAVLKKISNTP